MIDFLKRKFVQIYGWGIDYGLDDSIPTEPVRTYLLDEFSDGSCLAVDSDDVLAYEHGQPYSVEWFSHFTLVPGEYVKSAAEMAQWFALHNGVFLPDGRIQSTGCAEWLPEMWGLCGTKIEAGTYIFDPGWVITVD